MAGSRGAEADLHPEGHQDGNDTDGGSGSSKPEPPQSSSSTSKQPAPAPAPAPAAAVDRVPNYRLLEGAGGPALLALVPLDPQAAPRRAATTTSITTSTTMTTAAWNRAYYSAAGIRGAARRHQAAPVLLAAALAGPEDRGLWLRDYVAAVFSAAPVKSTSVLKVCAGSGRVWFGEEASKRAERAMMTYHLPTTYHPLAPTRTRPTPIVGSPVLQPQGQRPALHRGVHARGARDGPARLCPARGAPPRHAVSGLVGARGGALSVCAYIPAC